jgi:hypothetical protein
MYSEKDLSILREQLVTLGEFMRDTVDPEHPHRKAWWWTSDLPAYPELYEPVDWERANKSIEVIFGEYLYELEKAGLTEKLEQAKELPIADLLACTTENA